VHGSQLPSADVDGLTGRIEELNPFILEDRRITRRILVELVDHNMSYRMDLGCQAKYAKQKEE
jgi:hypothetical protein